ncbi:MAG: hypothetical protein AB7Q81_11860 [Gammaproteobacteria bacterium]
MALTAPSDEGDHLFVDDRGRGWDDQDRFSKAWNRLRAQAGADDLQFRDLRRTAAT